MKVLKSGDSLRADPRMGWATAFSDRDIKLIGAAEVTGALGIILPAASGVLPMLTPVAGVALAALMGGAAVVHLQRGESPVAPLVLGVLALIAGLLRWQHRRPRSTDSARASQETR